MLFVVRAQVCFSVGALEWILGLFRLMPGRHQIAIEVALLHTRDTRQRPPLRILYDQLLRRNAD